MHIEAEFACFTVSLVEIGAEIPIQEFNAILLGKAFAGSNDFFVVLIKTGQQGRGKVRKAVLGCIACGDLQPIFIAPGAAA